MRILIAVVLILVIVLVLIGYGGSLKQIGDLKNNKTVFSYLTFLLMGVVVMMGYLFVLYAKAF